MRPVAVFAHTGSMNIMLHRRLEGVLDPREDDKSVMQDTMKLILQSRQGNDQSAYQSVVK
jgi:hypothetical protein